MKLTSILACAAMLFMAACESRPPSAAEQADICDIFDDRKAWYRAAARAEDKWGAPIALQMAVLQAESSFDADARPPRGRTFFGLLPGRRPSSAYGYAQAVNETWAEYRRGSGNRNAERDDIDDATDFVAWYVDRTARRTGLARSDARGQYLAYHEGIGGYQRGSYRSKAWLVTRAGEVANTAARYDRQLERCERRLRRGFIPFL
ncbi:MAG: transglycosylase SLT domain-containing protein [Pseudomonadota bacterium]